MDNNKPQQPVESSPMQRKSKEKVQLAEQINRDYFASLCIVL